MKSLAQTLVAGATGALVVVVLMAQAGPLALRSDGIEFPDGTVQTTAAAVDSRRAFYQTISQWDGASARNACASGFHMASLWEIFDPSSLRYATDAEAANDAVRRADSGLGPPSAVSGWVRTGYSSSGSRPNSGTIGDGGFKNCDAWTSNASDRDGTTVSFNPCWQEDADCTIGPGIVNRVARWWRSFELQCSISSGVWCVQD